MKKVLVSINQRIAINPQTTFGGLVKVCEDSDAEVEYIGSIGNNYDFDGGRIRTSRFVEGAFVDGGFSSPNADLWIFYADGYQNDTAAMGFSRPLDYHERMMSFLETQVSSGNVGEVINSPETERRTLKSYFARLNPAEFGIIPTYLLAGVEELREALREKGKLVVKPDWGGGMNGVSLLSEGDDIREYESADFSGLVFQDYSPGEEKRMWVVDGKFADGRLIRMRNSPWENHAQDSVVLPYNLSSATEGLGGIELADFQRDVAATEKIAKEAGLMIGSVDFLGSRINELNGALKS